MNSVWQKNEVEHDINVIQNHFKHYLKQIYQTHK